jgi:hypothetical protein
MQLSETESLVNPRCIGQMQKSPATDPDSGPWILIKEINRFTAILAPRSKGGPFFYIMLSQSDRIWQNTCATHKLRDSPVKSSVSRYNF